jgi:energy-coupling factor transporter ATP-binding protein EcfA2
MKNVSHAYPQTLWRRLTSSVPRRMFSLQNISCTFSAQRNPDTVVQTTDSLLVTHGFLVLLLGASSSGKSTLLKLIHGTELPNEGTIQIISSSINNRSQELSSSSSSSTGHICCRLHSSKPILLNDRDPLPQQQRQITIRDHLVNTIHQALRYDSIDNNDNHIDNTRLLSSFQDALLIQMTDIVGSSLFFEKQLTSLTPSEYYRFRLIQASLESSLNNIDLNKFSDIAGLWSLPGPILLLDEWMDTETSLVTSKVVPLLEAMVESLGAVILSASHKPKLYKEALQLIKITLNAGKILDAELTN